VPVERHWFDGFYRRVIELPLSAGRSWPGGAGRGCIPEAVTQNTNGSYRVSDACGRVRQCVRRERVDLRHGQRRAVLIEPGDLVIGDEDGLL